MILRDITERKRHEEHTQLLIREVNHRAKNMLAVVQSIARQTVATKAEDFIGRFNERLQALSASQDLLVQKQWKGVDIAALVQSQLAHFKELIGTRIALKGPSLLISAAAAQTIGMALHELCTNAGKYGALSSGEGRLEVAWSLSAGEDKSFAMSWREKGGPAVAAPAKRGFGSIVIQRLAKESLDAEVDLDLRQAAFPGACGARSRKSWTAAAPSPLDDSRARSKAKQLFEATSARYWPVAAAGRMATASLYVAG